MAEKVKFSAAGRAQFPHMPAERLAIVRRRNAERNSITIVWDGTTTPITYASGFIEPVSDSSGHHAICEWNLDQYPWECTCGVTKPKAEWFDHAATEYEKRMSGADSSCPKEKT